MANFVENIVFGILSSEEIRSMAVCEITNTKLVGSGSVYDEFMGCLSDSHDACKTCGMEAKDCPGHFGYIELCEHILHPLFTKIIVLFLKCICKKCFRVIFHPDQLDLWGYTKLQRENRFSAILGRIDKIDICYHCKNSQPKVIYKVKEEQILFEYKQKASKEDVKKNKKNKVSIVANVEDIEKIFDNVKDEDVRLLGFNPKLTHPRNLIMKIFPVLPPCARPYGITDGNICDDDLTTQIAEIVKDNIKLMKIQQEEKKDMKKKQKFINSLKFHISTFYNNSKGRAKRPTDNQPIKGLKERLASKEGQLRKNHMGKRVNFSGRTVIGPGPHLKCNQIGMPTRMAKILTFPDKVTSYNIDELTFLVNNGKANFVTKNNTKTRISLFHALNQPGTDLCKRDIIIKDKSVKLYEKGKPTGESINVDMSFLDDLTPEQFVVVKKGNEKLVEGDRIIRDGKLLLNVRYATKRKFKLELGDIVERQLRNGDVIVFNRQPTLHKGSVLCGEIVLHEHKTLQLNLSYTKSLNADFDGDEINVHVPQSYQTVAELKHLSMIKHNIISAQESIPNLCIVQDSLLGAYCMTRWRRKIDKHRFLNICGKGDLLGKPIWNEKRIDQIKTVLKHFGKNDDPYNGHGLISLILPRDLYYQKTNNANPKEPTVSIYRGVMYEGALDKNILGSKANSLIQILSKEYSPEIACNFIDNIQFITNAWFLDEGFSIGIEDCMIVNQDNTNTIKQTLTECYVKAQSIEQSTFNPGIREVRVTAALSQAKDVGMKIAKEAMKESNNFLSTVYSGAKGDFFNIAQITGLLGQQNIFGKRVCATLNNGTRTLPHYPLVKEGKGNGMSKEREYESKGFIRHSFIRSLSPEEYFFHAMSGREGICDTGMNTAKSGYIQRKIVKVMEDIQVQYDGTVRDIAGNIYQFAYGENGWDPWNVVHVNGELEMCDISRLIDNLNYEYENESANEDVEDVNDADKFDQLELWLKEIRG